MIVVSVGGPLFVEGEVDKTTGNRMLAFPNLRGVRTFSKVTLVQLE